MSMSNKAPANRPVRLGLAGLGRVGTRHATNIIQCLPKLCLVRVQDADETVARARSAELGKIAWTTSYDDLVNDPDIEGIIIATPSTLHLEHIKRAAAAGKHIFVEKPIALSQQDNYSAITVAKEHCVRLQVGLQLRFDPTFLELKHLIEGGALGSIYQLHITHRDYRPRDPDFIATSGGLFADVTVHDLDLARFFVGEITEVTAFGGSLSPGFRQLGDIDNAIVALRFESGALGVIDNCRVAGYGFDLFAEVLGSKATVRATLPGKKGGIEILSDGKCTSEFVTRSSYDRAYIAEIEAFGLEVVRDGHEPKSSSLNGVAAFVLADAAALSLRECRTVHLSHQISDSVVTYRIK